MNNDDNDMTFGFPHLNSKELAQEGSPYPLRPTPITLDLLKRSVPIPCSLDPELDRQRREKDHR
jgi:hypothetical protein